MKGWRRGNLGFFVAKIPERKKPVILLQQDNKDYVMGQVRSEEEGEILLKTINYVMNGDERDGDFVRDAIADWDNQFPQGYERMKVYDNGKGCGNP